MASSSKRSRTAQKKSSLKQQQHGVVVEDVQPPGVVVDVETPNTPSESRTPSKKVRLNVAGDSVDDAQKHVAVTVPGSAVVTPAANRHRAPLDEDEDGNTAKNAPRRALFDSPGPRPVPITPSKKQAENDAEPKAKQRLMFGRLVTETVVPENVKQVYGIVRKLTGSIGGNGCHGPIYGELTMGSMQKMANLMKEYTGLDTSSRFIDVGSGIGKPNLHVAQDPGVEFSYGIEVEVSRWVLGLTCLKGVLDAAYEQSLTSADGRIQHRCIFEHGDIRDAQSFDPFTHVYMFSIGFPPPLWINLAEMWNRSSSPYLICYHGPRDIIKNYEFEVELVTQTSTSMHGSKEGHMAYIYQRVPLKPLELELQPCDPLFASAWEKVQGGLDTLRGEVTAKVEEKMSSGPSTRSSRRRGTK